MSYHPYRRTPLPGLPQPPIPSPAQKLILARAMADLAFYVDAGVLVSWNHQDGNWDIIPRPQRITANGFSPAGAGSFTSIAGFTFPLCPHLNPQGQPYAPMKLRLHKIIDQQPQDFFQAGDHVCSYQDATEEEEVARLLARSSRTPSASPSSSQVSSSSQPSSSSSQNSLPSSSSSGSCGGPIPPVRRPVPRLRTKDSPTHVSRFNAAAYTGRKYCDIALLDRCWEGILNGTFRTNPEHHPAYPKPESVTHKVLRTYDEAFTPTCLKITYQELRFFGSPIGSAIRALNSTLGISPEVMDAIVEDSVTCLVCCCQYSEDAFNDHIRMGNCGNCPEARAVASRPPPERRHDLQPRLVPQGQRLGNSAEFLDTPTAAALLQWNSRLGIPTDVWAVVSTARMECKACKLVRCFEGHAAHLDAEGKYLGNKTQGRGRCPGPSFLPAGKACCKRSKRPGALMNIQNIFSSMASRALPQIERFDTPLARQQSEQTELTVYSHILLSLVTVDWPCYPDGNKLHPADVIRFLLEQGVHWPCFCSRLTHQSLPCTILTTRTESYAYCHYTPARCSFFLSLHALFESTKRTYHYPNSMITLHPYHSLFNAVLEQQQVSYFAPMGVRGYLGDYEDGTVQTVKPLLFGTYHTFPSHPSVQNVEVQTVEVQTEKTNMEAESTIDGSLAPVPDMQQALFSQPS
ncbi:hypothetical protein C8R43DRAFT_959025 [Mycena crocata]|nr:hypothetical protein C8R43DRAFT_959025 [Mycena crocata]